MKVLFLEFKFIKMSRFFAYKQKNSVIFLPVGKIIGAPNAPAVRPSTLREPAPHSEDQGGRPAVLIILV